MKKSEEDLHRERRKDEHVELALSGARKDASHFDELSFVHLSLPETSVQDVDLEVKTPELNLSSPIYINGMTGGSEMTGKINASLAEVANATGIAMAVGSQHAALRNENLIDTFKIVRKINPNGTVFANVGADVPLEYAQKAVDMLEANALQIHINVPQELVMPEGGRDFTGWVKQIERIVQTVSVPVIVKEVGFGMSKDTYSLLKSAGVQYVDVSSRGGTNFIWIENARREKQEYEYLRGWGQTAPISLLEAQEFMDEQTFFASGGIRNPLDVVKCLALGAKATGIAGFILKKVQSEGIDGAIQEMLDWHEQLRAILTMLGVRRLEELAHVPLLIKGEVREWCELRGIDVWPFARRGLVK